MLNNKNVKKVEVFKLSYFRVLASINNLMSTLQ